MSVADFDLEQARAIFRQAPFVTDVGFEPTRLARGECDTELVIHDRHQQHTGQVHAGVITTMADHTAGAAAQTLLDGGRHVVTAELKLSMLRAARGDRLTCVAKVLKPGRALMFTEAEVHCWQGSESQLIAKFSATMAVINPTR